MARSPLTLLLLLLVALASTTPHYASAQRLSSLLNPADLAALRGLGGAGIADGKRDQETLDAPTVRCVDEDATPGSITLEVCAGESGAPLSVLVEWMNVLAFARNNGWYRGDDERLCRVRLTLPIARDMCRDVVIGGHEMRDMVKREYEEAVKRWRDEEEERKKKWEEEEKRKQEQQHHPKNNDKNDHHPDQQRPVLPAVLGDESCLDALEPDTYYVLRARARGDRAGEAGEEDDGGGKDEGTAKEKHDDGGGGGSLAPSLWSDNAVCATEPEEEEGVQGCATDG
jgi:hypothetical protein